MIIDCHGHYTTSPAALQGFRDAQLDVLRESGAQPAMPDIADDEIRESIENNQLRLMRERGTDLMVLSPKASAMTHHVDDVPTATAWARASNDLIHRVLTLFPRDFAGVCQLPQTPSGGLAASIAELRRCVDELGFVGCNLNPDPSGGFWTSKPLTDESWFPLFEVLVELDVPAMVHVSGSCNPNFHALGAHYLNADTTAFMQFIEGDLFSRFPTLRFVIPHGGGAVPYHWGRFRGLADRLHRPEPRDHVMGNVYFDTCVYHRPGVELLTSVIDPENILFASELLGAVPNGIDPDTGDAWDDTKKYLDAIGLPADHASKIFESNARRVYPRLDAQLVASGR